MKRDMLKIMDKVMSQLTLLLKMIPNQTTAVADYGRLDDPSDLLIYQDVKNHDSDNYHNGNYLSILSAIK